MEFLPTSPLDCQCTLDACPVIIAQRRLVRLGPRMAVMAAAKEGADPYFLNQLAMTTLSNPGYRRSGAATMFIRHIQQDKTTKGKRLWEISAMGIINVLAGIYQAKSELQDADILQEIHSSYRVIMDVVWKDFCSLSQVGAAGDSRRMIVAKLIDLFLLDPGMKLTMYDEKTAKLVLHCWLHTAPGSSVRNTVASAADSMFASRDFLGNKPPPQYLELAFQSYKITTFVSQANFGLKHKEMLGETLLQEISTISNFVRISEPFIPHLLKGGVHKQLAVAVRRQLKNDGDNKVTEAILEESGIFMQHLLQQSNDTMAMSISRGCPSTLERLAIPTVIALQEEVAVGGERKYLVQWTQVVRLLGITEQTIRERYRVDRKCCNLECPARNSGVPSPKKSTCTECKSVFYCDHACQTSDWKTHKAECERLAQEASADL